MSRERRVAMILALVWVVVVAYLGFTDSRGVLGLSDTIAEPAQHFTSFAVAAALLGIAFPGNRWRLAGGLVVAGVVGEFLQLTTDGRQFSLADMAMNLVGAAAGLVIASIAVAAPGPVFAATLALLIAAPFLLPVKTLPETSFPENCAVAPAPVGGEPTALLDIDPATASDFDDVSVRRIRDALVKTDEFAVETRFETPDLLQTGPARVFTMSEGIEPHQFNFHVGVDGSDLSVRFRTSCEWSNRVIIADVVVVGRPQHVVINWSGGVVDTWVDGTMVDRTQVVWGDLSAWDPDFVARIGDEVGGGRRFDGQVLSVSVWDRALDDDFIAERSGR